MTAILLGARLVLAAVFAAAGIAKLADRNGARDALESFGAPPRWAGPGAVALPVVELVVAAALIPQGSAWWAALGALGLLLLFSAAIGRVLARGERPDCRCFGQIRPQPVGGATLARNGGLAALALVVLVLGRHDPGPSVVGWLDPLGPADRTLATIGAVAVGLLAALTVLAIWLLVQQRQLLGALESIAARLEDEAPAAEREDARPPDKGLPIGAPAPSFVLPDLAGAPRALATLLEARRPVVLLFGSSGCDPCAALAPDLVRWQREHAATVSVVVVSSGTAEENRGKFSGLAADRVLLQGESEVADAYAAQWTPGAVLIGRTGRIASAVTYGDQAIRALVAQVVAVPDRPVAGPPEASRDRGGLSIVRSGGPPGLGAPAPPLSRPDLDGRTLDLGDYRGRDTLVVFWQPNCPHCQRLAEDLRRWEAEPPRGAPRLLIVSSGAVDENRALGFKSSVVLDEGFQIGKAFGARGTPSAVLVDAEGRVASTVAVGARDVLALAGLVPPIRARGTAPSV